MKKFCVPSFAMFILMLLCGISSAQEIGQTNSIQQGGEKIYKQSEVDQKAKIIKRSYPTTDRMCNDDSGIIRVLVILHKSGTVGGVETLTPSECQRFNENSPAAAKKIKFKPAIKDGQAVSVSVIVEYNYSTF